MTSSMTLILTTMDRPALLVSETTCPVITFLVFLALRATLSSPFHFVHDPHHPSPYLPRGPLTGLMPFWPTLRLGAAAGVHASSLVPCRLRSMPLSSLLPPALLLVIYYLAGSLSMCVLHRPLKYTLAILQHLCCPCQPSLMRLQTFRYSNNTALVPICNDCCSKAEPTA